ncbi:MAG: TrmH family RNA methyltransferase [Microcoleaceae cyanobacterium]
MITSLQNPLIKQIRKLHQAKGRQEQQLFLLEGTHLLEGAIAANHPLTAVCITASWQEKYPDLWQQVESYASRTEIVSETVLAAIATTVTPDGVVATAPRSVCAITQVPRLGLALETIQDPGNLGTIIRTAVAAGVGGLWLSQDSVDLDHPKVLRASAGTWFKLPMMTCPDLSTELLSWRNAGVQIVATLPTASLSFWDANLTQPTMIVLGNEGAGLSKTLVELADHRIQIPLEPTVESLNVSICAALLLYEVRRQRYSCKVESSESNASEGS